MTFKIFAHRGMGVTNIDREFQKKTKYPENTLMAFERAIDLGAGGFELDVAMTKGGKIVVVHDDELNINVLNADKGSSDLLNTENYFYDDLKLFNVGCNQPMPLLSDVLDLVIKKGREKNFFINIEVKGKDTHFPTLDLINSYSNKIKKENFIINTFKWEKLYALRERDKDIRLVPNFKTMTLFGKENVKMPGYIVDENARYQSSFYKVVKDLHKDINCFALDCVVGDIREELVTLCLENNIGLCISNSSVKKSEKDLLKKLGLLESNPLGLLNFSVFKADNVLKARKFRDTLKSYLENPLLEPEFLITERANIRDAFWHKLK